MNIATLQITGIRDVQPGSSELERGLPPGIVQVKSSAHVHAARAGSAPITFEGLQPDDVVEIELEDGLCVWSRVEDLERDYGVRRSRAAAGDVIDLPATLQIGGPSRGWAGWAIKALKIIGINLEKAIGDFAADYVEGRLRPGPGLYQCSESTAADLRPVEILEGTGPTLVFLHGTASSTAGSFEGLWGGSSSPIADLFRFYEGRVLALQHETLTKSPIENAAFLAQRLSELRAQDAEIHLVSHSRGGLIGELLCRGMRVGSAPFTPDELALFDTTERQRDRKALDALNKTLEGAKFRVTRFVRVACPARGTTLADGRLDRYFTVLVNLASLIPGLRGNPVYEGLTSLLAGVLKQRAKPEDLPGLEAMMPVSPLVRTLNRPSVRTDADLHVLGGDLAGTGVLGRLKTLATDMYYREDHDLVVNTPAMLGGTQRTGTVRYWIDTGNDVTHFNYFARSDTAGRLVGALTDRGLDYHTLQTQPFAVTANSYRKRALAPQPIVFILPGIMGSELSMGETRVWVDLIALADEGLEKLRLGGEAVISATGLISKGYGALCEHLTATHDVVPFPYDWRQSINTSGDLLRQAIEVRVDQAEADGQPIRLLAHSMGGLVVRAMLASERGQALWKRLCHHAGARFVMLGTPNGGSHAIPAMLIGRDALVKNLALIDVRRDYQGLLETLISFDGVLDLLPREFMELERWQRIHDHDAPADRGLFESGGSSSKSAGFEWRLPTAEALARAKEIREALARGPLDPGRVIYVAGTADETRVIS